MRERPILFRAEMVNAILDGRKTQTRRLVKRVFRHRFGERGRVADAIVDVDGAPSALDMAPDNWELCPYGVTGDRLWVKETFAGDDLCGFAYRADHPKADLRAGDLDDGELEIRHWRPSIHMPRKAARLVLEIETTRVERLQSITEDDARAEGCERSDDYAEPWGAPSARHAFRDLWERINGADSWAGNPWVWALTFKVIDSWRETERRYEVRGG
jgi:hypothetical protein